MEIVWDWLKRIMELIEYIRLRNKMTQSEWENSFEKEEREIIILRHEGGGSSWKKVACPELKEILTEYRKPVVIKDDDLFFGHSIAVNGSPKKGLLSVDIEG